MPFYVRRYCSVSQCVRTERSTRKEIVLPTLIFVKNRSGRHSGAAAPLFFYNFLQSNWTSGNDFSAASLL